MTRAEAIQKLRQEQENSDIEVAHSNADAVLCELLRDLGYSDIVDEYNKVNKWYA